MYRIWVGLDPHVIMSAIGSFIAGCVLVIHLFAFRVVNYPDYGKYNPKAAAAAQR